MFAKIMLKTPSRNVRRRISNSRTYLKRYGRQTEANGLRFTILCDGAQSRLGLLFSERLESIREAGPYRYLLFTILAEATME